MYKVSKTTKPFGEIISIQIGNSCIPCDPANTDYANFKAQINADEAQLEDADGTLMTAEQAKAYVATLP
jgi:hypothetical protein